MGFQIFAGIHAGALAGFFTCFRSPVKICTFFVPRSLSLIFVMPLLAAFNAACLGDFPVKTPSSLPFASLRAKFLATFSVIVTPSNILKQLCAQATSGIIYITDIQEVLGKFEDSAVFLSAFIVILSAISVIKARFSPTSNGQDRP
jgi:hypothetical protein